MDAVVKIPGNFRISLLHADYRPESLTATNSEPSSEEAEKSGLLLGRNSSYPMIHPALSGIAGDKFCQRSTEKALQYRNKDKAVDDGSWPSGIDFRHNTQAQSCPGNSSSGCEPYQ